MEAKPDKKVVFAKPVFSNYITDMDDQMQPQGIPQEPQDVPANDPALVPEEAPQEGSEVETQEPSESQDLGLDESESSEGN